MTHEAVAIVTGGASGIGRAIATRLAQVPYRLAVFDLDGPGARASVTDDDLGLETDVTDPASVQAAVETVVDRFGRVDLLVNNAGISGSPQATTCHETPVDEWERVMAVNLRGPFVCARAVLPTMLAQGGGHVVTIVSISGMVPTPGRCAYTASKGGALMLTRSLAVDYAGRGIRSNAVCPGLVQTPMTQWRLDVPEQHRAIVDAIPAGRVGQPEDVAEAVAMLASDGLAYMTGHALVIDGGSTLSMGLMSADAALADAAS